MSTYKEEVKILAELCKKCGGRCCIGNDITISKTELKKLKSRYYFSSGVLESSYGKIPTIKISKNKPCPFIGKVKGKHAKIGCILEGKMRPLGCRLFPLTFLIEKGEVNFYLSAFCPYVHEVAKLKKWIKKTINDAREELKTWTKAEKLTRSYLHRRIHQNHKYLIKIEIK